jgi:hypothetical protein
MKKCAGCKTMKQTSSFNRSSLQKSGLRTRCKDCERIAARLFYKNNPTPYRQRAKVQKKKLKETLFRCMDWLRLSGCVFCGEKEACALDFHHMQPGRPVTQAANHSRSSFIKEVCKCILVCATCHRKCHAKKLNPTPEMRLTLTADQVKTFL